MDLAQWLRISDNVSYHHAVGRDNNARRSVIRRSVEGQGRPRKPGTQTDDGNIAPNATIPVLLRKSLFFR